MCPETGLEYHMNTGDHILAQRSHFSFKLDTPFIDSHILFIASTDRTGWSGIGKMNLLYWSRRIERPAEWEVPE